LHADLYINHHLSLQITASTFRVQAAQHLKLQAIHTKYRKTLTVTNNAVPICTAPSPIFTVLSVPATYLVVVSFSGHTDENRFRPWSPIAKGNHLNGTEKIPLFAHEIGNFEVFNKRSGISAPMMRSDYASSNLHE